MSAFTDFNFFEREATQRESTLTLEYDKIEDIVAFILNFEWDEITDPETMREKILPKLREFLTDYY